MWRRRLTDYVKTRKHYHFEFQCPFAFAKCKKISISNENFFFHKLLAKTEPNMKLNCVEKNSERKRKSGKNEKNRANGKKKIGEV